VNAIRRIGLGAIAGAALAIALVLIIAGSRGTSSRSRTTRPITAPVVVPSAPVSQARGTARQRLTILQVEQAFTSSYLAFLDGDTPISRLRFVSVTARGQARQGGRIPPVFRDGQLQIRNVTGDATEYSAQATITAADRSQSYVFTVQLLRERIGWIVAQMQPPDFSVDDGTRPVSGPPIPPAARLASSRFAVAYAAYRVERAPRPMLMSTTASQQLSYGQDPLATVAPRPGGAPRLLALHYGPLEGSEFAVTATVAAGGERQQFSLLMVNGPSGWECDAFI
jgi:hypothetical protein